jgi:UDP-GlcNAc3NAcA epimerase
MRIGSDLGIRFSFGIRRSDFGLRGAFCHNLLPDVRMTKVLSVVGARPQFIKAAPVSRALRQAGICEVLLHTGQHYDPQMSEVFFAELGIPEPDLNLNVGSGPHGAQTGAMLTGIERTILQQKPDWVLVYGDTNSTLAGALAAAKLHVPVAHVEAGLRSFNRRMPEEINRIVADTLASMLFVPTETGRRNLLREGVPEDRISWTGDVMYDAMLMFQDPATKGSDVLQRLGLENSPYVLATVHRAENTDDPVRLEAIIEGLRTVAETLRVVLPLHPRTRVRIKELAQFETEGLLIIEPLGFLDMIRLEMAARVIATDSGGVQKEAFFHRVPCVTLRNETEWTELVDLGWNRVVPPLLSDSIADAIREACGTVGTAGNPYGDGHASARIAEALQVRLEGSCSDFRSQRCEVTRAQK